MKNQYFGDLNDYKKYGLIRLLSGHGQIKTAICWILTKDDNRTDGRKIRYLSQPEKWKNFDPILYEHLKGLVIKRRLRSVNHIEKDNILNNCKFYKDIMYDSIESRELFFNNFLRFSKGVDLVFFDPDNGIAIKSIPRGRRSSSKYIYWNEIQASYEAGHSIMIYQHFPRKPREPFLRDLVRKFKNIIHVRQVFSYCTYHVAFLLVPQFHHQEMFLENSNRVKEVWGDVIKVRNHKLTLSTKS